MLALLTQSLLELVVQLQQVGQAFLLVQAVLVPPLLALLLLGVESVAIVLLPLLLRVLGVLAAAVLIRLMLLAAQELQVKVLQVALVTQQQALYITGEEVVVQAE
jgi:hypothetical protein